MSSSANQSASPFSPSSWEPRAGLAQTQTVHLQPKPATSSPLLQDYQTNLNRCNKVAWHCSAVRCAALAPLLQEGFDLKALGHTAREVPDREPLDLETPKPLEAVGALYKPPADPLTDSLMRVRVRRSRANKGCGPKTMRHAPWPGEMNQNQPKVKDPTKTQAPKQEPCKGNGKPRANPRKAQKTATATSPKPTTEAQQNWCGRPKPRGVLAKTRGLGNEVPSSRLCHEAKTGCEGLRKAITMHMHIHIHIYTYIYTYIYIYIHILNTHMVSRDSKGHPVPPSKGGDDTTPGENKE